MGFEPGMTSDCNIYTVVANEVERERARDRWRDLRWRENKFSAPVAGGWGKKERDDVTSQEGLRRRWRGRAGGTFYTSTVVS